MIECISAHGRAWHRVIYACFHMTEKDVQALERRAGDGRGVDVLERLSEQSRQVRAEAYRSLHHMTLQRAQLQTSLQRQTEPSDHTAQLTQNGVSCETCCLYDAI